MFLQWSLVALAESRLHKRFSKTVYWRLYRKVYMRDEPLKLDF
jgi:hypothetical protein